MGPELEDELHDAEGAEQPVADADAGTTIATEPATDAAPAKTGDREARIAELTSIMETDIDRYHREGLSDELLRLRKEAEGGDEGESGQPPRFAPPADASPEEVASWREQHGIPTEASGYSLVEVDGHTWGEQDRATLDSFNQAAHAANLPAEQHSALLRWYAENSARVVENDRADFASLKETLVADLGEAGYRTAAQGLKNYLGGLGDLGKQLAGARMADGRLALNDPSMVHLLLQRAASARPELQREGRKAEIEQTMARSVDEYRAKGMDREYREILQAADRKPAQPLSSADTARIAQIEKIMRSSMEQYWRTPGSARRWESAASAVPLRRSGGNERAAIICLSIRCHCDDKFCWSRTRRRALSPNVSMRHTDRASAASGLR
jgi:hypothetical protein